MAASEVVGNDAVIIESDVGKVRAAGTISNRPDPRSSRLEAFVYLHVAALSGFYSR
jgi:hypothetical protein